MVLGINKKGQLGIIICVLAFYNVSVAGTKKKSLCQQALAKTIPALCKTASCLGLAFGLNLGAPSFAFSQEEQIERREETNRKIDELALGIDDEIIGERIEQFITLLQNPTAQTGAVLGLQELILSPETGKYLVEYPLNSGKFENARSVVLKLLSDYFKESPSSELEQITIRLSDNEGVDIFPSLFFKATATDGYLVLEQAANYYIEQGQFRVAADLLRNAIRILPEKNRGQKVYKNEITRLWSVLASVYIFNRDRSSLESHIRYAQAKLSQYPYLYDDLPIQNWQTAMDSLNESREYPLDSYGIEYLLYRIEKASEEFFYSDSTLSGRALDFLKNADLRTFITLSEQNIQTLLEVLQTGYWLLQRRALEFLEVLGPQALSAFESAKALSESDYWDIREQALKTLASICREDIDKALPIILNRLGDTDPDVTNTARQIISNITVTEQNIPTLLEVLQTRNESAQLKALDLLERLGPQALSALEPAKAFSENEYWRIREQALKTLASICREEMDKALPMILSRLGDTDPSVKNTAREVISNITVTEQNIPTLVEVLQTGSPQARLKALEWIASLGSKASSAADAVRELTTSDHSLVSEKARETLKAISSGS